MVLVVEISTNETSPEQLTSTYTITHQKVQL